MPLRPTPQAETAYRVLTPATATLPLDPDATAARLGLTGADADLVPGYIDAVREAAETFLGYPLAYQLYEQTYFYVQGDYLLIHPRPVTSIVSVVDGDGDELVGGQDYALQDPLRSPRLYKRFGFATRFFSDLVPTSSIDAFFLTLVDGGTPDWTVQFHAGYWLPTMSGSPPAGVPVLNPAIAAALFVAVADMATAEGENTRVDRVVEDSTQINLRPDAYALPPRAEMLLRPYKRARL